MAQRRRRPKVPSGQPRRASLHDEVWDLQRTVQLLRVQIANEGSTLNGWLRRLELRKAYEETHACTTELPALRQEAARCHARLLELQRRLMSTRVHLRTLLAEQEARSHL